MMFRSIFVFLSMGLLPCLLFAQHPLPDSAVYLAAGGRFTSYRYYYTSLGTPEKIVAYHENGFSVNEDFVRYASNGLSIHPMMPDYASRRGIFYSTYNGELDTGTFGIASLIDPVKDFYFSYHRDSLTGDLYLQSGSLKVLDSATGIALWTENYRRKDNQVDTISFASTIEKDSQGRLTKVVNGNSLQVLRYRLDGELDSVISFSIVNDSTLNARELVTNIQSFERRPWHGWGSYNPYNEVYPRLGLLSADFYTYNGSSWVFDYHFEQRFDSVGRLLYRENKDTRERRTHYPEGGIQFNRLEDLGGPIWFEQTSSRRYEDARPILQFDSVRDIVGNQPPPDSSIKHVGTWTFFYHSADVVSIERPIEQVGTAISSSHPNTGLLSPMSRIVLFTISGQRLFEGVWEELRRDLPSAGVYFFETNDSMGRRKLLITP